MKVLNGWKKKRTPQTEKPVKKIESVPQISLLINSAYFFLESVFIVRESDDYRLVAIQNGRLITNENYRTIKNARIAFSRLYSHRGWKNQIKAQWSFFYEPDRNWLKQRIKTA